MALAISLRLDFVDAKGKTSFTKVRIPNGNVLTDYHEFAEGISQLVANISDAQITGASLCFNVSLAGLGLATVASSVTSVAKKLFLQFRTAVTGFNAKTLIPGLREPLVIAGSDDVDQTDVDVAAVISAFEDGIVVTGGTMTFTNDREQDIVAVSTAKERFRRRKSA